MGWNITFSHVRCSVCKMVKISPVSKGSCAHHSSTWSALGGSPDSPGGASKEGDTFAGGTENPGYNEDSGWECWRSGAGVVPGPGEAAPLPSEGGVECRAVEKVPSREGKSSEARGEGRWGSVCGNRSPVPGPPMALPSSEHGLRAGSGSGRTEDAGQTAAPHAFRASRRLGATLVRAYVSVSLIPSASHCCGLAAWPRAHG